MLLQPRWFLYKRKQKHRSLLSFNNLQPGLRFGSSGLMLLKPLQLTAAQLFRFKLFLKRSTKKADSTRRFCWFHAFPHIPLTRKPNGVRMGKGKGKLECWFTNVSGGTLLLEFRNLRYGRSLFFVRQLGHKFGVPVKAVFATQRVFIPYPLNFGKSSPFRLTW